MNFKNIAWAAGITMLASYMIYGSAETMPAYARGARTVPERKRFLAAREGGLKLNIAGKPVISRDHPSMKLKQNE